MDFMTIAAGAQERPLESSVAERHYRLWLFNGCTSNDYVDTIRASAPANPSLGSRELDMTVLGQPGWAAQVADTALNYLDGILARETAAGLEQRAELAQPGGLGGVDYENRGFEDNPG